MVQIEAYLEKIMMQNKINKYWGVLISFFDFDIKNHCITMILRIENEQTVTIKFIEVLGYRFDYSEYLESQNDSMEPWQIIELSEFHFIPELKKMKYHDTTLDSENYHFMIEMYQSRLFIRSRFIQIDDELVPLPTLSRSR